MARAYTLLAILAFAGFVAESADAEDYLWRETWAGADVSRNVWLVYSGTTVSPFSSMHAQGPKLRFSGGYGQYRYDCAAGPNGALTTCEGTASYADVLAGWLFRVGELTAKGFAGVSMISHEIAPFDPETMAIGPDFGAKGVVELWLNLGRSGFASLDLAWAEAHNTRSARSRVGFEVHPGLTAGLEAALSLDAQGECRIAQEDESACKVTYNQERDRAELLDYGRGGLFARYAWEGGEASVSAGVLGGNFDLEGWDEVDPYVTVNWLTQY